MCHYGAARACHDLSHVVSCMIHSILIMIHPRLVMTRASS